ncbi:MAG: trigger factor [Clostridia bacterium]|nr:trigger factor [Clostridia bacterium]
MKYSVATAEKSTVKVTIEFDGAEWAEAINKAYAKNKSKYSVNGFRKGKVPKHVLEMYYGKGIFFDDALNILFGENYPSVIEKEAANFTAVGDPTPSVEKLEDDGVTIAAIVPVKPEVKIGSYKGMKIRKFEYTVSDADIAVELTKLQERNARKVEVTDRPCANGDTVTIDFSGSVDGVKFEGGTAEKYELELGSNSFIPGFEEQVCGMAIGEEKDITVTFPENYQAENLKGKEAIFAIKLHKIEGKDLPEVTDEFVKDAAGCDTVEEYKNKTRERLEKQAAKRSQDETENSIVNAISETVEVVVPDAMVEKQVDALVQNAEYRLMYQGLKLEDYLRYMGRTMESFRGDFKEQAEKNVVDQLIVEKIIKDEGITASQEEIEEQIAKQAASVDKTAEEYKKTMDPRQIEYISSDIMVTKLFKFLEENNELYTEEA